MIVECPACHTRYRTDSADILDEGTLFECSQEECRHIFAYSPPLWGGDEKIPACEPLPPFPPTEPSEASFDEQTEVPREPPSHTMEPLPEEAADHLVDFAPLETPFFADGEEEDDEQVLLSPPPSQPTAEVVFSLRPLLMLLGVLVLGYAGLTFYCLSHPADTHVALTRLPLLGSLFTAQRFSAQHITLTGLTGSYWLTKDNRRVFAVSGTATNTAPVPARSIQIEGILYDADGKIVGQRVIFCGTETAAAVLPSLSVREIGILQNLVPPKQFHVPPGQTENFLLVFTTPPPTIAEFSSRVIAAQFG